MSNQLVKRDPSEGYKSVFPKTFIDAVKDRESGVHLNEILSSFNMYFLSFTGDAFSTRCKVPISLRKEGLWITYVRYDHSVVTEWYNAESIDDASWGDDSNWRVASNKLVGDISISSNGYWVINNVITKAKAQGDSGITPMLKVGGNGKLQVSYNEGKHWVDISECITPRFRWVQGDASNAGAIQISMDLGNTWTDLSNQISNNLKISKYIGINEELPTSNIDEGTVYMKGPYYAEDDVNNDNPIYRMWVYAWKGNTLAWQDNGEFTSISAGIVQTTGNSETEAMSQAAVTKELTELTSDVREVSAEIRGEILQVSTITVAASSALGTKLFQQLQVGKKYLFKSNTLCNLEYPTNEGSYKHLFDNQTEVEFVCPADFDEKQNQIFVNKEAKVANIVISQINIGLEKGLQEVRNELGSYIENDEYLRIYIDSEDKFVFGIRRDGTIEWAKGVPVPVKNYVKATILESEPELLSVIKLEPAENYDMYSEVVEDKNKNLLSWRDRKGVKHETLLKVENELRLSKGSMSKFIQSLIESGFTTENPIDHSDESSISIPIPRSCAVVNIVSPLGLATTKTQNIECYLEYLDKSGNYFKKPIILNAQGSSSMSYIEKNQSIDILNEDGESCEITFGNWVAQDSFHLKCYYIDVFRGICNVGYNIAEEAIKKMDSRNNRVKFDRNEITPYQSTGDFATDFTDCALCHPDGFPFELYVNDEYYGLFAWNLKKHRSNYSMKKDNYKEVLLDGILDNSTFFNGNINWTQFELRNPKTLITMTGGKYDGDNPVEIIDSSSGSYDSTNKDHVNTATCKELVKQFANVLPQIRNASDSDAKNLFENHFDKKAMICYFIVSNVLYHYDGFAKNWIWTIYDNIAAPSFYDMDTLFGREYTGLKVLTNSTTSILGSSSETITGQMIRLYKDEIDSEYKMLRESGVLTIDNIMKYVVSWMETATYEAIKRNLKKWTSIPSYRASKNQDDGSMVGGMYDSPYRIKKWLTQRFETLDVYFNLK